MEIQRMDRVGEWEAFTEVILKDIVERPDVLFGVWPPTGCMQDVKSLSEKFIDMDQSGPFQDVILKESLLSFKEIARKVAEAAYGYKSIRSIREDVWWVDYFAPWVKDHIITYTIPQYGDAPDDQVGAWTAKDCCRSILRYANRFGRNSRGDEESVRDFYKTAHYSCLAHFRYLAGAK